jgi:hypothetical protein
MFESFDTPVRCSDGHLFTTIWVPLASIKAVRLGGTRYQYCPVGHHWATVTRLDADGTGNREAGGHGSATEAELAQAALVHDVHIP